MRTVTKDENIPKGAYCKGCKNLSVSEWGYFDGSSGDDDTDYCCDIHGLLKEKDNKPLKNPSCLEENP